MNFLERLLIEINKAGITKNKLLTDLKLSKNSFVAWENRGTIPSGETLDKLADYFNVTTDYLLGRTDDPNPKLLHIPGELQGMSVAFHRGEFEELTQDEVDALAVIAKTFKDQRKRKEE